MLSAFLVGESSLHEWHLAKALSATKRVRVVASLSTAAASHAETPSDIVIVCLKSGLTHTLGRVLQKPTLSPCLVVAERPSSALARACVSRQVSCLAAPESSEQIVSAAELCVRGVVFYSANLVALLPTKPASGGWTDVDVQILLLLGEGLPLRQVAHRLSYSEGTVRNMCSRLYRRLGAGNRLGALLEARKIGLL